MVGSLLCLEVEEFFLWRSLCDKRSFVSFGMMTFFEDAFVMLAL